MAAIRPEHMEQVERWALFVKENPTKWKRIHTQFIDSLFLNQQRVYKELSKTKEGKRTLIELYGIKNLDGYPSLKD